MKHRISKQIWLIVGGVSAAAISIILVINKAEISPPKVLPDTTGIESTIDAVLREYQIDNKSIRVRTIPIGAGTFVRVEKRISVEQDFNALNFNHDLSVALAHTGAKVVATEKSEDRAVTVHVKRDGIIVQSLAFIPRKKRNP